MFPGTKVGNIIVISITKMLQRCYKDWTQADMERARYL